MQTILNRILLVMFLILGGTSIAFAKQNAKHNYSGAMKAIPYLTVKFEPGSSALSEGDRNKLRDLVSSARKKDAIDQVTVAAWSDKAFPINGKLLQSDRDLAQDRADAVSMYLKAQADIANVETYNMAEDTNWLARTFKTSDSELKSVFGKRDANTPVTNAEFQIIKNEGAPTEAVVIVQRPVK